MSSLGELLDKHAGDHHPVKADSSKPPISNPGGQDPEKIAPRRGAEGRKKGQLTRRQRQVAELLAAGLSNKQVAAKIRLSLKTVEKHRNEAYHKLGVREVVSLVHLALARGWVANIYSAAPDYEI